ncbi:MAG TPA: filamentous hemagglutinin N-terminal domain-containing protein, partial [Steroidobacteraceae bacterium]
MAGPTGGTVVQGQGSISTPSSGQTVINQSSQRLMLNWSSFNVGANESVRFYQPSSSAIAFNRILGQSASQIFGQIDANGKVVLINPNGLLIGRTAQLNVSSLVVSSLDAIDFNAANGRYRFSATRGDPGAVVNEGTITAQPGGSVTLLGGSVSNSGTIVADYGTVNLAAGRMATLDLAGDGLLRLEVGGDLASNSSGVASAVENSGIIAANGGHVFLTANAVKNVFENLVNNTGVVRANRIDNSGGTIELLGPGGTVLSSGTLDASAGDAISTGGTVSVLGDHVGLLGNAVVNVSGAAGGGTALIGGDAHGANPDVLDATETYVSSGATLNADAGETGDGGRIVVWSNDFTRYYGSLSARGGTLSGNGGFAEVSGKKTLEFLGLADLTAAHGAWGTLLLDPDDITIDGSSDTPPGGFTGGDFTASGTTPINIGALTIDQLLTTTNVQLSTTGSISTVAGPTAGLNGTIDVSTTGKLGASLSLSAGTGITLNYPIATNNGAITLTTSGGDITMQGTSSLNAGSALISMEADSGSIVSSNGGLVTAGSLHFTAGGSIGTVSNPVNTSLGGTGTTQSIYAVANGGDVYIDPTSAVELTTTVATSNVNVTGTGNIAVDDV